jgi:hypothetical protein
MPGENLDLTNEPTAAGAAQPMRSARPFLGVHFSCCGVYARVYINADQTAYVGHCPRCSRRIQFRIGAEGVESRFFTAY